MEEEVGALSAATEEMDVSAGENETLDKEVVSTAYDEEEMYDEEDEDVEEEYAGKKHLNLVFIGHVDAGKSTISGQIMCLTGHVDPRTMAKYEREAKARNRDAWAVAFVMDTNEEERAKGKTVYCGVASFATEHKFFTLLDAPGHKAFVPNMIGGAIQADVGVLVISARQGEFEAGFQRGGQTSEHAILVKTAGVKQLVVLVNKMDDPSVMWDEGRYKSIITKLSPFLKSIGFNPKNDVWFLPVSGLSGHNLKDPISPSICPWYKGQCFFEIMDDMPPPERLLDAPLRLPVFDKYKDMGTVIVGKVESGCVSNGDKLILLPNRTEVEVLDIYVISRAVERAEPGDNIRIRVKGIDDEDVRAGFVLCHPEKPIPVCTKFEASLMLLELKSILTAGYSCMLHVHAAVEECTIYQIVALLDNKTRQVKQRHPKFVKPGSTCVVRIETTVPVVMEPYDEFDRLGRFMLRDEGKTIGVGKVTRLPRQRK